MFLRREGSEQGRLRGGPLSQIQGLGRVLLLLFGEEGPGSGSPHTEGGDPTARASQGRRGESGERAARPRWPWPWAGPPPAGCISPGSPGLDSGHRNAQDTPDLVVTEGGKSGFP